ncbi:MAG: TonB-dependent receptor [Bacteroidia bacterium]|nr:TonB-dependent receptor [Bacteroidia bacterium]
MKKSLSSFLFFIGFLSAGWAQTGLVVGTITDQTTGEALPGASVQIAGTSTGASTNLAGEFSLRMNTGNNRLLVSYLGYEDQEMPVTVEEGQTVSLDIQMKAAANQLADIIITGQIQGQAKALNQQRTADNIKNIVAADQIGRFPDPNAAEALQRVPGVNIERDQGEGRYVLIRGLSPKFTNVSINGEQIPSPEADVRFVALDAVPADQLASMEVTKALTPDMDGDAIGGSVNLITRTAASASPTISASLVGGYNNLMQEPNIQGSLQYGQRFGANEKFGVMLNSSYYHNALGSDNWEREPFDNELEFRDYELTRTRLGASTTLDYRFNENHEIYFRGIYNRFTDREWRRRYVFVPEDDEIEKLTKDRFESQSILSFNVGGRHTLPKFYLDYEFAYAYAEQDTPFDDEVTFLAGIPSTLDFTSNLDFPRFQAENYLDNSLYEFDSFEYGNTLAKDENITAKFNVGIPYNLGENTGEIKFGAKVRLKEKSFTIVQNNFESIGDVPNLDFFEGGLLDDNFLDGRYQLTPNVEVGQFIRYFNANPAQFELQVEDKSIDEAVEAYTANEDVFAGYVMTRQRFNKLLLLAGVRYERTSVNYESSDVIIAPNGDLEEIRPVSGGTDYDFWLPQVHLKYELSPYTNLRAAATFSYARPNFSEIIPAQEINREDNEATVGNPALKPVSAFNADLFAEHYFGNVGIISGGLFYKRLNDFIFPRVLLGTQYPLTGSPIINDIDVIQVQNGQDADLFGLELAYQQNLTFLPGFLSGLGAYFNYTYTRSEARIQNREITAPKRLTCPVRPNTSVTSPCRTNPKPSVPDWQ